MSERNQPALPGDVIVKIESPHQSAIADGTHLVVIDVLSGDDSAVVIDGNGNIETLWYPDQYRVVGTVAEKIKEMYGKAHISKPMTGEDIRALYNERFGIDLKIKNEKNPPL